MRLTNRWSLLLYGGAGGMLESGLRGAQRTRADDEILISVERHAGADQMIEPTMVRSSQRVALRSQIEYYCSRRENNGRHLYRRRAARAHSCSHTLFPVRAS